MAGEYLEQVCISIAGPMTIVLVRGRKYVYVIVDDYTHVPLPLVPCDTEVMSKFQVEYIT